MENSFSQKFKENEESHRVFLEDKYVVYRLDGRGFSKFTKRFEKPFDKHFSDAMIAGAYKLANSFQALLVYTQSDEVSIVLSPKHGLFNGRTDKLLSLSASIMSVEFAHKLSEHYPDIYDNAPAFDSRVLAFDTFKEATEAVMWRYYDGKRNSVSMYSHYKFGHKAIVNKSTEEQLVMLEDAGASWSKLPNSVKYGTLIARKEFETTLSNDIPKEYRPTGPIIRRRYETVDFGDTKQGFEAALLATF